MRKYIGLSAIVLAWAAQCSGAQAQITSATFSFTSGSGAFAKDLYFFTKDATGAVTSTQLIGQYRYSQTTGATLTPLAGAPVVLSVGSYATYGLKMVAYQDLSYSGALNNPVTFMSDAANASTWYKTTGACTDTAGQTINLEDNAGTDFLDLVLNFKCVGTVTPPPPPPPPTVGALTITPTSGFGAYAKDLFVWAKDSTGKIVSSQTVLTYRYSPATGATFTPAVNAPISVQLPTTYATSGLGLVAYQDTTYQGALTNPVTFYSDAANASVWLKMTGLCTDAAGATANIEDAAGTDFQDLVLNVKCASSTPSSGALGKWSAVTTFPLVPVSASMLPNGKLMFWAGSSTNVFGAGGVTYSMIYDPATDTKGGLIVTNTGQEIFCEGTTLLADGRLVVTGGTNGGLTSIVSTAGAYSVGPALNVPRGYHSSTLTSSGRVFTLGGSWSGGYGGKVGELYAPGGSWTKLTGVAPDDFLTADPEGVYRSDNHMWLFGADNGWVFHAGPAKKMHWVNTAGTGSVVAAGLRGADGDAMNGNAIMYDVNKILTVGGAPSYINALPTTNAYTIDLSPGVGVAPIVKQTGSMAYNRSYANSVVLPTGQVVVMGGAGNGATTFSDTNSVFAAEMWEPATGKFRTLASAVTPRNYHSFAVLLMDGRVLSGGGGLCGGWGCTVDHPDAEIFTPPYLLNADGTAATRPVLSAAPTTARPGTNITVSATGAASYALVRMSAVTHSVNNDQRRIPLRIASTASGTATLAIPASTGVVLPGNYMLFAMSSSGVPSQAKVINIQ